MALVLSAGLLVCGFVLLVKGADAFVDGAGGLATRLGVPPLVVGLTVVAFGTSAPEAAISITSSITGADGLAIANVFGSNIMNTLVILGTAALVAELPIQASTLRIEIPFVLAVTALLLVLGAFDGSVGRVDAVLLLVCLAGYLGYMVYLARKAGPGKGGEHVGDDGRSARRLALLVVGGGIGIALGSRLTVDGATGLARAFGMSERTIGLTVVAFGTSLPEFVTTLVAARKGEADIAIGDIVGSSVFNILFVLGVSAAVTPLPFARELFLDGAVALLASGLLWLACRRTRSLRRAWGAAMVALYGVYLVLLLLAA